MALEMCTCVFYAGGVGDKKKTAPVVYETRSLLLIMEIMAVRNRIEFREG